jgi:NADH-quinone oxidoreductase subunit J
MTYALYVGSFIGSVSLLLMLPRHGFTPRKFGALLGAATLGGLWLFLADHFDQILHVRMAYYYIFSFLAIASAVSVITHTKPVFSALWFVMLVLASAGLLLLLDAEFIAFAMVIIYGGAILVTYVFVIMLATQSVEPGNEESAPGYDRIARQPAAAVATGFLLLAVLLTVTFRPIEPISQRKAMSDAATISMQLSDRRVNHLVEKAAVEDPALLADASRVENVERIGLDLFEKHPLGLELAGVILLVSLVGAVVIARKRIEAQA